MMLHTNKLQKYAASYVIVAAHSITALAVSCARGQEAYLSGSHLKAFEYRCVRNIFKCCNNLWVSLKCLCTDLLMFFPSVGGQRCLGLHNAEELGAILALKPKFLAGRFK